MNIHINTSKLWYTLWINLIDLTLDTIAPAWHQVPSYIQLHLNSLIDD